MIFLFSKLGVYNKLSLLIFTLFSFTFFSNNIYSQSDFSPVVDVSLSNLTPHPTYVFVHYSHPTLLQRVQNLRS